MSEYERDPRFTDGAPVVSTEGEQGRIVGFDPQDGEYLVFPLPLGDGPTDAETQWWNPTETTFDIDPNPQPWPGEDARPLGVFVHHRPDGGIELFAAVDDLLNSDELSAEKEKTLLGQLALGCVADPGETYDTSTSGSISYQPIQGSG